MYNFHWFNVWQKSTYGKAIILQLNKQLINFFKTRVRSKIYPHVYCSKLNVRWWLRARASLPYWTQVSNGEMQWTFPLDCKESKPVNRKGNQSWIFIGRTDAEVEAPILWPHDAKSRLIRKDWYWERLKAEGEGDGRGQCGWMASPTQWTWVWASFWRWWRTGKSSMLQFMGSQSWTQLSNWTITTFYYIQT